MMGRNILPGGAGSRKTLASRNARPVTDNGASQVMVNRPQAQGDIETAALPGLSAGMSTPKGSRTVHANQCNDKDLQNQASEGGAKTGALSADSGPSAPIPAPAADPDLAAVARVWPTLPESVKAEIVAMVTAAGQAKG